MESNEIIIKPELPIGTEFYFMENNTIKLGLIAAYNVHVTSCVDNSRSWCDQLFARFINNTQKETYKYDYGY